MSETTIQLMFLLLFLVFALFLLPGVYFVRLLEKILSSGLIEALAEMASDHRLHTQSSETGDNTNTGPTATIATSLRESSSGPTARTETPRYRRRFSPLPLKRKRTNPSLGRNATRPRN